MSVEEDTELRNLVAQTLENKGILPKIRAELRANVFLALEENPTARETILKNEELSAFIQIPVGILILNLIREFLEFFGLDFTLSVFDPETKFGKDYSGIAREKMIKELNISECRKKGPLLYEIISKAVRDFKDESKNNFKTDKNVSLDLNHCDASLNGEAEIESPNSRLNSTFVKYKSEDVLSPLGDSPHSNGDNEHNESIEEELISNKSCTSENSSNEMDLKKMDQTGNSADSPESPANEHQNPFKPMPDNSTEFDLLTFTPVKEVKARERVNCEEQEDKRKKNEVKDKGKANASALGDLPPLNAAKTDAKKNKMNEIKAIIDRGLNVDSYEDDFHSSLSSKSSRNDRDEGDDSDKLTVQSTDRSDKSEKTDVAEEDNLDDDLSDLINNHNSTYNQLTMDETVSKLSDVADHLESL